MATLLSSPPTGYNTMRLNLFEQPSSPTRHHDDLPAEFYDRSFGSSMSLGSSFEPSEEVPTPRKNEGGDRHQGRLFSHFEARAPISAAHMAAFHGNALALMPSWSSSDFLAAFSPEHALLTGSPQRRASPPRSGGLGAALGTQLSEKSPNLAAKLSSPYYMDISPAPAHVAANAPAAERVEEMEVPRRRSSPKTTYGRSPEAASSESMSPGSAMKEDDPSFANRASSALPSSPSPPPTARGSWTGALPAGSAGGSLGRLFGTALANQASRGSEVFGDTSLDSPEGKRPLKKRPSSLPLGGHQPRHRPSIRSAGLLPSSGPWAASNTARRPTKGKSTSLTQGTSGSTSQARRRPSSEKLRLHHRISDPAMRARPAARPARPRAASADSTFEDLLEADGASGYGGPSRSAAQACPSTIIELPSPPAREESSLGAFFFDPQSPEQLANLSVNSSSSPATSPLKGKDMSHAVVLSSASGLRNGGRRMVEKASSVAALPSFGHVLQEASAAASKSSLGKRTVSTRRPCLAPIQSGEGVPDSVVGPKAHSSHPDFEAPSLTQRLTAPAPRRYHSAVVAPQQGVREPRLQLLGQGMLCSPGDASFGTNAGSPAAPSSPLGPSRHPSKDDSSPLGYGSRRRQIVEHAELGIDSSQSPRPSTRASAVMCSSPYSSDGLPGFGLSEREGKILPCFSVRDDGLMRIQPQTLVELMGGRYDDRIVDFHIIDCRFGYEYEGGHIAHAVNLSTVERVKSHLLSPGQGLHATRPLPRRSQSGKPDANGQPRKTVLVFHCEFSAKRAPSMALALRQADRALAQDYPRCHFPELYVLQGGYAGFFAQYPEMCAPQRYVRMDDPLYQEKRSSELGRFRAQFNRNRSFTYGEAGGRAAQAQAQAKAIAAAKTRASATSANNVGTALGPAEPRKGDAFVPAIREEDTSMDTSMASFDGGRGRADSAKPTDPHARAGFGVLTSRALGPRSFGSALSSVCDESTSSVEDSFEHERTPCAPRTSNAPLGVSKASTLTTNKPTRRPSMLVPGPAPARNVARGRAPASTEARRDGCRGNSTSSSAAVVHPRHALHRAHTASTVLR